MARQRHSLYGKECERARAEGGTGGRGLEIQVLGRRGGPIAHLHVSSAEHRLPQPPSPWKSPVGTGKDPDPEILESREP